VLLLLQQKGREKQSERVLRELGRREEMSIEF
jgi:hypothetical protein